MLGQNNGFLTTEYKRITTVIVATFPDRSWSKGENLLLLREYIK